MGFIGDSIGSLKSINVRQALEQAITLGMIVSSALILWKFLINLYKFPHQATNLGDILFLRMGEDPIRAGEIVVFNIDRREIPIVHRVIKVHQRNDTSDIDILTKGDNNPTNDRGLYAPGQQWLQRRHIMGRAVGFLPYVGYITIVMTEKPIIKYVLIGALGFLALTSKD
ncbi:unnamed protein product [Lactuca virosa]|uniref:Signal peptidase I n=1 Tax=Lactuca virosa TaxID=75947 RepID=A0AAU9M7A3_9ASTR|nr:unnamed protein product [Lactuca virosa]